MIINWKSISLNYVLIELTFGSQVFGGIFAGIAVREHFTLEEHDDRVRFERHR